MDPQHLGKLLEGEPSSHVFPLSFLALINSVRAFSIPRKHLSKDNIMQVTKQKNKESSQIIQTKKNGTNNDIPKSEDKHNKINLNLPLIITNEESNIYKCGNHPKLKNLFLKHVNLKKRHEISVMAELVHEVALKSGCDTVIDFGSGLGHLVRMLAYKYDLKAAGIEGQSQLIDTARYKCFYSQNIS